MERKIIHYLTQWKVLIPVMILLFILPFLPIRKSSSQDTLTQTSNVEQRTIQEKSLGISSLFGVKKKFQCSVATAQAVIDDTRVSAKITQQKEVIRAIFDGDCFYKWIEGDKNGERSCGLRTYTPLISQLGESGQIEKLYPVAKDLINSCKETMRVNEEEFKIPKEVLFKNKKFY